MKGEVMKFLNRMALATVLTLVPGLVGAWTAQNHHKVAFVSDTVFEVVGRPGSAGQEYWCAAGEFARNVVGASAVQRVHLVRGPAVAQTSNWNRAVLFSLTPPQNGNVRPRITLSVSRVGDNMSAAMAESYCRPDLVEGP